MSTKKKLNQKRNTIASEESIQEHLKKRVLRHRKHPTVNLIFNIFAKKVSDVVGNAFTFILALIIVMIWAFLGHYFKYSDTWQLIINTGTTIVTFLVVFLIQNTQNRDTEILNLKIDELIKSHKGADNKVINLSELSDSELKDLEREYCKIKDKRTGK